MRATVRRARRWAAVAAVCVVLGLAWAPAGAQQESEPKAPPSVDVQVFVIMASKAEVEHTDPALKELADLLKTQFKDRFNRFRLYRSPQHSVKQGTMSPFALVGDYTLWVDYGGVKQETGQPEKVILTLKMVKTVEYTDSSGARRKREEAVMVPMKVSVERNKFIPMGGPEVGEETMFLAVRVLK